MSKTGIKVIIPQFLTPFTDGVKETIVCGETVGDCIYDLIKRFPSIRQYLLNENNGVPGHIDIYINRESTYPEELLKKVNDGDEMHIINVISGG